MDLWKKDVSGRGNSQCEGLEVWDVWEPACRAVWKGHRGRRGFSLRWEKHQPASM